MATTKTMNRKTVSSPTVQETKPKTKEFAEHDGIECISCTAGQLLVEGLRTKTLYDWHGIGDSIEVEYGDLISMVRSKSKYVFKPRFIIHDQDFIDQNKTVKDFYENMYTIDDLREILTMSEEEIKNTLPKLPLGAQDAVKSLVCGAVNDGTLDSVHIIKAFDEFFGTKMLVKVVGS